MKSLVKLYYLDAQFSQPLGTTNRHCRRMEMWGKLVVALNFHVCC